MKSIKKSKKLVLGLIVIGFFSCQKQEISPDETVLSKKKLSEYTIYQGSPHDLIPASDYKLYELSSQLFTDYAEKQRLIKLPAGTTMSVVDNGLLNFSDGTIIVKTFYYFKDKRNPSSGKKIIETRILEKLDGKWIAGTYMWNESQTEANLIGIGLNKTVNWIDETGNGNVISYHIPSNLECKTCHNSDKTIVPIGPKTKHLNFDVVRNNTTLNQLTYFHNEGLLNAVNPSSHLSVPNYNDATLTLEERGRAYLDINCAHCHNAKGFGSNENFRMEFETDLNTSKIKSRKSAIRNQMENGTMPKIGTTIIDKEGLELIKKYLETL